MSLPCKSKLFKFLLISIFLLAGTIACNSIINSKTSSVKLQKVNAKPCPLESVQVQQEKIMSRLERIETKFKRRKLRRMKNRI